MSESILVIGGDSQIGKELTKHFLSTGITTVGTTRKVNQNAYLQRFELGEGPEKFDCEFETVYICAGITSIKACDQDWEFSNKVNVLDSFKTACEFSKRGSKIIFVSSSEVFDGKAPFRDVDEIGQPTSSYGQQKLKMEGLLTSLSSNHTILRLSKVQSSQHNIVRTWRQSASSSKRIDVHSGRFMAPVTTVSAVSALVKLKEEKGGIYQLSNRKEFSMLEIAELMMAYESIPRDYLNVLIDGNWSLHDSLQTSDLLFNYSDNFNDLEGFYSHCVQRVRDFD